MYNSMQPFDFSSKWNYKKSESIWIHLYQSKRWVKAQALSGRRSWNHCWYVPACTSLLSCTKLQCAPNSPQSPSTSQFAVRSSQFTVHSAKVGTLQRTAFCIINLNPSVSTLHWSVGTLWPCYTETWLQVLPTDLNQLHHHPMRCTLTTS